MAYEHYLACCGVRELADIRASIFPENALEALDHTKTAFVVFTDVAPYEYGVSLAAYIRKRKLGTVVTMIPKKNPNSGNRLKVWLWSIDQKKWAAWKRANR
jgi:hypothetical protein